MLHLLELLHKTLRSFVKQNALHAFKSKLGERVPLFCLFNAKVAEFLFCRIQVQKSAGSEEYI